ncbi:protein phosphatase 1H-like isoform X1 [Artemia franciscana]|uniref:PPM-type phosphatase domain-containing protein n=1 Tax=Artemia franciscana TaxID=6661 RepID=A0AA88LCX0_ARTSF|nr:hypothetical protein QYM36_003811 [Artemia franciscana]
MLNKFRNALYSVVNGAEGYPGERDVNDGNPGKLAPKFPYSRPNFLQLHSQDEVMVAGDHNIRPIIVPRDISKLPWNTGYAEAVNAGKSLKNEDQSAIYEGFLERNTRVSTSPAKEATDLTAESDLADSAGGYRLPYYYFAIFDGHAGSGAAVSAANQLHYILHEKLVDIIDHLMPENELETVPGKPVKMFIPAKDLGFQSLVVGALEAAFWEMDKLIEEDRFRYKITGGCTALVALFILGKLFVANAGDCRAVWCRETGAVDMSNDFTPETERRRIRKLAALKPELLGASFTALDYLRRPTKNDIGQRMLYREPYMTGWAYKTIAEDDLKVPVVFGDGKRSRVLATIGVTRGFGDHDLKAQLGGVPIKPFLTSQPEVRILDLEQESITELDVLVMGSDGLWDVTSSDIAAKVVLSSIQGFLPEDDSRYKYRLTSAAQDLVMNSRGKHTQKGWRTVEEKVATVDDISVFVIPLLPYKVEYEQWQKQICPEKLSIVETSHECSNTREMVNADTGDAEMKETKPADADGLER